MLLKFFGFLVTLLFSLFLFTNGVMTSPNSSEVTFVVYGDMPYLILLQNGKTDDQVLTEEIAPLIRDREDVPFVIHVGDLSRPEYSCSDTWLKNTKTFWTNEIRKPVFYTPGDNDWTDCDRPNIPNPKSELERLEAIRTIIFSEPKTLDSEWRYEQQVELPENQLWWQGNLVFVTQHMVSTDNGTTEFLLDDPEKIMNEVEERDQANQVWLNHAFDLAKNQDAQAVVIATQVDPFTPTEDNKNLSDLEKCLNNSAYEGFCSQIQNSAAQFNKPVLLIHGDTNAYCLNQPFSQEIAPKLWRLNAPGDFKYIDASVVSFHPDADQPFEAMGILSGEPAPTVCDYSQ